MPRYDFACERCGVAWEQQLTIADRRTPESSPCPHCQASDSVVLAPAAPAFGDSMRMGIRKPSDGFKDKLRAIKQAHRGSTVNV